MSRLRTLVAAGLLAAPLASGCGALGGELELITYKATATGDVTEASISWVWRDAAAEGGGTPREKNNRRVPLPWEKRVALHHQGSARLSVGVVNGRSGSVTCSIYRGDTVIQRAVSATGLNPQVTCAAPPAVR